MLYLAEYAHCFYLLTAEQLKKDLEYWDRAPQSVYLLQLHQPPLRRRVMKAENGQWIISD